MGYTLWGCKESDMTERLSTQAWLLCNVVLISAVQQMNQPHAYISPLFEFPSHLGHHRALSRVPCTIQ